MAFTRVEAAQALGLSASTIDRLTRRGFLRAQRITRRPLYAVEVIACSSPEECAQTLGPRWAFVVTQVGLSVCGGHLESGRVLDLPQRVVAYSGLMQVARRRESRAPAQVVQKAAPGI